MVAMVTASVLQARSALRQHRAAVQHYISDGFLTLVQRCRNIVRLLNRDIFR